MHCVVLTEAETAAADLIGRTRRAEDLSARCPQRHGASQVFGLHIDLIGARSEAAVAKFYGMPHAKGNVGDPRDVGLYGVRGTEWGHGCLLLHAKDLDHVPYVLVLAPPLSSRRRTYIIRGWMFARDGKRPRWWRDPVGGRPAYFVPQSVLRPMSELVLQKVAI